MKTPHPVPFLALMAAMAACGGRTSASADAGGEIDDSGTPLDMYACGGPGTCTYVPKTCCGSCTATVDDAEAIATPYVDARRTQLCGGTTRPVCPKCAWFPPPRNVAAICQSGRCAMLDLHASDLSSCETDADCVIRDGPCCESCAPYEYGDLLALRKDRLGDYTALVCLPTATCSTCAPRYPTSVGVVCDATKHCALTGLH